jgi:5S rRNA maturation endonuclease (ribonuclease M5)
VTPAWIEQAKAVPVSVVAERLGLDVRSRSFGPCPSCGAEAREREGRHRPPCGIICGDRGWRCFRCDATGDGLNLVGLHLARKVVREMAPAERRLVRGWYARHGWCEDGAGSPATAAWRRTPPPPPVPPPEYPPAHEVTELWRRCLPLTAAPDAVRAWFDEYRGINHGAVSALDLARFLPADASLPRWVPTLGLGSRWRALYRVVIPMFDAAGEMRALRFRAVSPIPTGRGAAWAPPAGITLNHGELWADVRGERRRLPKSLSPRGSVRGLVLADPAGRALLAGDLAAWDGWVPIVEGEPDLWAVACTRRSPTDGLTFATLGVTAGSWTPDLAARVPEGANVLVWTDHDEKGEHYAAGIINSLADHCRVLRARRADTWGKSHER